MSEDRVLAALQTLGLERTVIRHGQVASLAETARQCRVELRDVIKTMVVRRGPDDYLFVLIPRDRECNWPKLRKLLGVQRLSTPDTQTTLKVTGFTPGTMTPFGASRPWPVIADAAILGRRVTMGAGAPGVAICLTADTMLAALNATAADITEPPVPAS